MQPARQYMPTDKAAVERFFRTIKELLAQLPGYKGEDPSARGRHPEDDVVFTVSQQQRGDSDNPGRESDTPGAQEVEGA